MSRKNRSIFIVIAVVACLMFAPTSAWAGPGSAPTSMTAEAPSMMHWLEAVWARIVAIAAPATRFEKDGTPAPPTESGSSQDPWG